MRLHGILSLSLLAVLLTSCARNGAVEVGAESFCDNAVRICIHPTDDEITDDTAQAILENNRKGERFCRWKPCR